MKKGLVWTACACAAAAVIGWTLSMGGAMAESEDKLNVIASFYPMYDFAQKIGGDRIEVVNLVPAGTEPHDWEPAASDIANLEQADVFIYNGAGLEHWTDDVLKSLDNGKLVVAEASSGLELNEGGEDGGYDPHVWLSPVNAKVEMANIRDALTKADPDGAEVYGANYDQWAAELDKLDAEYKETIATLSNKDIVTAHQAFGYLCQTYGLNQVAIEGLSPDSEPSPARMAEVIEYCKEHAVKVIFFEELVNPDVAETIASATGATTDVLNPIEGLTDDQVTAGDDYFSIMRQNLEALKNALR